MVLHIDTAHTHTLIVCQSWLSFRIVHLRLDIHKGVIHVHKVATTTHCSSTLAVVICDKISESTNSMKKGQIENSMPSRGQP
jgi:hypothetical protein